MITLAFFTQGCRTNKAETAQLKNLFAQGGFEIVHLEQNPQIIIINTCTVTHKSDSDTRRLISKFVRVNPKIKIALIGCQAQIKKQELLALPQVFWVFGNEEKKTIVELIKKNLDNQIIKVSEPTGKTFKNKAYSYDKSLTRANINIQDGCDNYCTYCIVPYARGPARSRDFEDILNEAKYLIEKDIKELVITGINISNYADNKKNLIDLLQSLLSLDGDFRIRVSSIEPSPLLKDLLLLMNNNKKLCPFLHLPIQSGSDSVLTNMKRKYNIAEIKQYLSFIKDLPYITKNICLGTDIIVGFPGETDQDFEETQAFLKKHKFSYFHVFSYSDRALTKSINLENKVSENIKKERSFQLRQLSQEKNQKFIEKFKNTKRQVLIEEKKNGYWYGFTDNYIKLKTKSEKNLKNTFLFLEI
jgi:threonylcarbamoyladenosine tRNA methylthiotransferase MtaB